MKKSFISAVLLFVSNITNLNSQPTWTQQISPVTTDLNSACAVNTSLCWMCGSGGVVIRTTNGGIEWSLRNSGLAGNDFYSVFASSSENAWVGADNGGLWHTVNGGVNWQFTPLSPPATFIDAIHFFNLNSGFVLGDPVNMQWRYFITTNGGVNWTFSPNSPITNTAVEAGWNNSYSAIDTSHIWWGTSAAKLWKGSFRGIFTSVPLGNSQYPNSTGVAFNDISHGIVAISGSSPGPVVLTTSGGVNWITGLFTPEILPHCLKSVIGTSYSWMACGNSSSGIIYRTSDYGISFSQQLNISYGVYCISMLDINRGWCGTSAGKIYKYTDNVGIEPPGTVPARFELKQNYPNPFNPVTTIDYSLARTGYVSLKVYNLLGQDVLTLVDGVEDAGDHNVNLNAANLPSGTYFYTLRSGDYTATKSLVLVK